MMVNFSVLEETCLDPFTVRKREYHTAMFACEDVPKIHQVRQSSRPYVNIYHWGIDMEGSY